MSTPVTSPEIKVPELPPPVAPVEVGAPPEASKPPERVISRIQQFTEGLGVTPDQLSPKAKQLFDKLNDESQQMSDDERFKMFKDYSVSLQTDPALSEDVKKYLQNAMVVLETQLKQGTLTQDKVLEGIKGFVESPELNLDDIQKQLAKDAIKEMQDVVKDPQGGDDIRKESKLRELFVRIPKPLRIALLALMAIFGLTLVKAFKATSGGGQMAYAA